MKKITLLFATLLAMSGMAFGHVLSKSLWVNEVDSIGVWASSRGLPSRQRHRVKQLFITTICHIGYL